MMNRDAALEQIKEMTDCMVDRSYTRDEMKEKRQEVIDFVFDLFDE